MSFDLPHTRSSPAASPPQNTNSVSTLLLQQTLDAARNKVDRKGKGSQRVKKRERTRIEIGSEGGDVEGVEVEAHAPPPPAYEVAIEQSTSSFSPRPVARPISRSRTVSNASISSSSSSLASSSTYSVTSDTEDALSDLLRLTTSLLTTSNEILQTSHSLHTQISRFLISSSPPPATTPILEGNNDGARWKELETLERDVERFGMRKEGKDPRKNLMRAGKSQRAVTTGVTSESSGSSERKEESNEMEPERSVMNGEEEDQVISEISTRTTSLGRVGGAGHLRRSSTAKDLLLQLSTPPNSTSTKTSKSTFLPTPSPSPRASTSRETLDFPSPTPSLLSSSRKSSLAREIVDSPSPSASTHKLTISPSLPSLSSSSSSASISTLLSHSPLPASPSPATPASSSRIRTLNTKASPSLTSITPSLSSFDSPSPSSTISTSPPTSRRRPSSSTHRRTSTITKSNAVSSLDSDSQDPLHSGSTVEARQMIGGGAALDRLRMLRGEVGEENGGKSKEAGSGTGSSWWGWR